MSKLLHYNSLVVWRILIGESFFFFGIGQFVSQIKGLVTQYRIAAVSHAGV